jgi:predicted protein tyrosine phosphatase
VSDKQYLLASEHLRLVETLKKSVPGFKFDSSVRSQSHREETENGLSGTIPCMPWIGNYSYADIRSGNHAIEPNRTVLIRIMGIGHVFEEADVARRSEFLNIYKFAFEDLEPTEVHDETQFGEMVPVQAVIMHWYMRDALNAGYNVVVHCVQGLCRSGAVTEVGVMMGFNDLGRPRLPNMHVKKLLMKQAGFDWNQLFEDRMKSEATSQYYTQTEGGILRPREE